MKRERILVIALLVSSILALAVSMTFRVHPPDVSVYDGDVLLVQCSNGVGESDIAEGFHRFVFVRSGYASKVVETVVSSPTVLEVELSPLGYLEVYSTPSGATVLIDGQPEGVTPFTGETPAGTHTLTVVKEGYITESRTIEVLPFEVSRYTFNMLPDGTTRFGSQPPGAVVRVDGRLVGTTPVSTVLDPGVHDFEMELDGYFVHRGFITVQEGKVTEIHVELVPKAFLKIEGAPTGAIFELDGSLVVKMPIVTKPGTHTLSVYAPGYQTHVEEVVLFPGMNEMQMELKRDKVTLTVEATPECIVQVDDLPFSLTPASFVLLPGTWEIRLMRAKNGELEIIWKDRIVLATNTHLSIDATARGTVEFVSLNPIVLDDGKQKYVTPCILHLKPGVYRFTAETQEGYSFEFWVSIEGAEYELVDLDRRLVAYINVVTDTAGATVTLDGKLLGNTPLLGHEIPVGAHVLEVRTPSRVHKEVIIAPVGEVINLKYDF
ncbi:MAG: PEGA domain-containing protein [Thermotogae bacterium]|nr:PEGA domain-containing protein [Thermotogota bacterium]